MPGNRPIPERGVPALFRRIQNGPWRRGALRASGQCIVHNRSTAMVNVRVPHKCAYILQSISFQVAVLRINSYHQVVHARPDRDQERVAAGIGSPLLPQDNG